MEKSLRITKVLIGLLLGIIFFSLTLFFTRLYISPISFKQGNLLLETLLSIPQNNIKVETKETTLHWIIQQGTLALKSSNVNVISSNPNIKKINFNNIVFFIPLINILKGSLTPNIIQINKLDATINLSNQNKTSFIDFLQNFLKSTSHSIKEIEINKAKINLLNTNQNILQIPELNFKLSRNSNTINASLSSNTIGSILLFTELNYGLNEFNSKIIMKDINISKIIPLFYEQNNLVNFIKNIDIPISGSIQTNLTFDGEIKNFNFDINNKPGLILISELHSHPYKINKSSIKGSVLKNKINITNLNLLSENSSLHSTGTIDVFPSIFSPKNIKINSQNLLTKIPINQLDKFWPEKIAPLPRNWIIKNISHGNIPEATSQISLSIELNETPTILLNDISGYIKIDNATVDYLNGLPKAHSIDAIANYDKNKFIIDISNGKSNDLKTTKGKIIITDLDSEDQDINIKLLITGSLQDTLNLINNKPLKFAEHFGISPSKTSGTTDINLSLEFPLSTSLSLKEIKPYVNATIKNAYISNPLNNELFPFDLENGDFNLIINNNILKISGKANFKDIIANISLKENFSKSSSWLKKITIKSSVDYNQLNFFKVNVFPYFKGKTFANIQYISKNKDFSTITLNLDLKQTDIDIQILGLHKPKGKPAHAECSLTLEKGFLKNIDKLNINSKSYLTLNSSASFEKDVKVIISKLKFNNNILNGSITKSKLGPYIVDLRSSFFNIKPLIEFKGYDELNVLKIPINLNLQIYQALIDKNPVLKNLNLTANIYDSELNSLQIKGNTVNNDKKNNFSIQINPTNSSKNIEILADDFGGFLKVFDIKSEIKGGKFTLKGKKNNSEENKNWTGDIYIQNFQVIKSNFLSKILALATPIGIFDLFSTKGMSFLSFKCNFSFTHNKIILAEGKGVGSSLGLTLSGIIDRKMKTLKLYGTMIPAYIINSLISHIPIIGPLISGGKGEGIFSIGFTVKGNYDNPEISINPISILTPGFLKKIFTSN